MHFLPSPSQALFTKHTLFILIYTPNRSFDRIMTAPKAIIFYTYSVTINKYSKREFTLFTFARLWFVSRDYHKLNSQTTLCPNTKRYPSPLTKFGNETHEWTDTTNAFNIHFTQSLQRTKIFQWSPSEFHCCDTLDQWVLMELHLLVITCKRVLWCYRLHLRLKTSHFLIVGDKK